MQALFTALFGPVFAKELIELARRRRYYLVRVLYGLGMLFVLFIAFQSYDWRWNQSGGANIRLMAEFAESMFRSVGIVQFIALFAFVPMFLCGAVAGEREEQTLELLFTTTLADREIILGKMLSRLVIFSLLILMTLPIFGFISLLGGISPPALFRLIGAMLTALFYVGAQSIYYSTVTKSPTGALLRAYWHMALSLLAFPFVVLVVLRMFHGPTVILVIPYIVGFICCTNPLAPLMIAVVPEFYEGVAGQAARLGWGLGDWFFPLLLVIPWVWSCFLIHRAVRRLRLSPTIVRSLIIRFLPIGKIHRSLTNVAAGPLERFRSPRERLLWVVPILNPLWLRARQSYCFDREGHLGRLQTWGWVFAAAILLLIGIGGYVDHDQVFKRPAIAVAFLSITWTVVAIFITIVAGISVVGDRRRGFFDLLLTTPLTNHQIVDGVFLAVWAHVARIAILPVGLSLLFLWTGAGKIPNLASSLAVAYLFMIVVTLFGVACSLCARTLAGALVPACLFVFITNIGIAFLVPTFQRHTPAVLWFICAAGLFATSYWVRHRVTPASVGCYFLLVFQSMVTVATSWITWSDNTDRAILVAASMPSFLAFSVLSESRTPVDFIPFAEWIRPCHFFATVAFCIWARWWLAAHFEALVGRAATRERLPGSLATGTNAIVRFFYWHIPEWLRPRWPSKAKPAEDPIEPVLTDSAREWSAIATGHADNPRE